jgi:hypothetical protein
VDVLPDGRIALVVQHRLRGVNRLELRVGGRARLLDKSAHAFPDADVQHDARGRLVIAWRRILEGAQVQAFAWTPNGGRQQVSNERGAVGRFALSVAPNGRTALAYASPGGVFVSRRSPGGLFQSPVAVAPAGTYAAAPGVGVSRRGRVVVAWSDGTRLLARAAQGAAPFGMTQPVALRPAAAGNQLIVEAPKVAIASDGRAVVAAPTFEVRPGAPSALTRTVTDSRVEAFDWGAIDARPSIGVTLSRAAAAGPPDLVPVGKSVAVAWTQRPKGFPRALWITRWTPAGIQRPNVYDTHALDLPVVLTRAPRGAVDAFYATGAERWFTVRLGAAGLYRGTSAVTPPSERVAEIDAAATGRHAVAAWTFRGRGFQVRFAQPQR